MISYREIRQTPPRARRWILTALCLSGLAAGVAHGLGTDEERGGEAASLPPIGVQETEAGSQELPAQRSLTDLAGAVTAEEEEALRLVDEILQEQRVLLSGQNFIYQSDGRRDPFRSLLLLRQRALTAPEERPSGLAGFLVNEVIVKAVARYQGRWHALLVGLDQRSYFTEVGTQLYDGRIIEISDVEVIFEQEVQDMLGARSTRKLVKKLKPGT